MDNLPSCTESFIDSDVEFGICIVRRNILLSNKWNTFGKRWYIRGGSLVEKGREYCFINREYSIRITSNFITTNDINTHDSLYSNKKSLIRKQI